MVVNLILYGLVALVGFSESRKPDEVFLGPDGKNGSIEDVLFAIRELGRVELASLEQQVAITTDEIISQHNLRQNRIESLTVDFTYSQNRRFLIEGIWNSNKPVAPDYSYRILGGFSGIKQFISKSDIVDGRETSPIVYNFDGKRTVLYSAPAAFVFKARAPVEMVPMISMLNRLLLFVTDDELGTRQEEDLFLPSILALPNIESRFLNSESADGYECAVLVLGDRMVLWIDADHGCVVRRLAWFSPVMSQPGAYVLNWLIEYRDMEKVDELWFPKQCFYYQFNNGWNIDHEIGELQLTADYRLASVAINENADKSLFDWRIPDDTEVLDRDTGVRHVTASANENIKRVAEDLVAGRKRRMLTLLDGTLLVLVVSLVSILALRIWNK